jgi:hypothetical protein
MPREPTWQRRLRDALVQAWPGWVDAGALFALVEAQIPLRLALRHVHRYGGNDARITPSTARWYLFFRELTRQRIETDPVLPRGKLKGAGIQVRLREPPRQCAICGAVFTPLLARTVTCGKSCASALRWRTIKQREQRCDAGESSD